VNNNHQYTLEQIGQNVATILTKMTFMEKKIDTIDGKLSHLDSEFKMMKTKMNELEISVQHMSDCADRLDGLEKDVDTVIKEMTGKMKTLISDND
jgi:predicted  nucleic acid-binding Zn-ribbon protein